MHMRQILLACLFGMASHAVDLQRVTSGEISSVNKADWVFRQPFDASAPPESANATSSMPRDLNTLFERQQGCYDTAYPYPNTCAPGHCCNVNACCEVSGSCLDASRYHCCSDGRQCPLGTECCNGRCCYSGTACYQYRTGSLAGQYVCASPGQINADTTITRSATQVSVTYRTSATTRYSTSYTTSDYTIQTATTINSVFYSSAPRSATAVPPYSSASAYTNADDDDAGSTTTRTQTATTGITSTARTTVTASASAAAAAAGGGAMAKGAMFSVHAGHMCAAAALVLLPAFVL